MQENYESWNWSDEKKTGKGKRGNYTCCLWNCKKYDVKPDDIKTLETKYHDDAGDWYVALGWDEKKAIIRMDSVQGTITEIKEI